MRDQARYGDIFFFSFMIVCFLIPIAVAIHRTEQTTDRIEKQNKIILKKVK